MPGSPFEGTPPPYASAALSVVSTSSMDAGVA